LDKPSFFRNLATILWYFLNIAAYRLLIMPLFPLLPKFALVPAALHLFKLLEWWEAYWVEYYLNNGKNYFENVKLIRNNPVCMKTTLLAYEYVFCHAKYFSGWNS
jgi:hypothetical protein